MPRFSSDFDAIFWMQMSLLAMFLMAAKEQPEIGCRAGVLDTAVALLWHVHHYLVFASK